MFEGVSDSRRLATLLSRFSGFAAVVSLPVLAGLMLLECIYQISACTFENGMAAGCFTHPYRTCGNSYAEVLVFSPFVLLWVAIYVYKSIKNSEHGAELMNFIQRKGIHSIKLFIVKNQFNLAAFGQRMRNPHRKNVVLELDVRLPLPFLGFRFVEVVGVCLKQCGSNPVLYTYFAAVFHEKLGFRPISDNTANIVRVNRHVMVNKLGYKLPLCLTCHDKCE
jgi:hypothetical protein